MLNEAAVAKICDVDEDIVANSLFMVFIVGFWLGEEIVEVADVAEDEEVVGEVE